MTTGIMMLAQAVLEVKTPTMTMITSIKNVVKYYPIARFS